MKKILYNRIIIRPTTKSLLRYFEKIAMLKTIKKVFGLKLKNFSFLLILFALFFNNNLKAQEAEKKFIGFIDSLEGSVNKEDVDDLIKLNAFDQIFTNDKIKIGPDSSIIISFIFEVGSICFTPSPFGELVKQYLHLKLHALL